MYGVHGSITFCMFPYGVNGSITFCINGLMFCTFLYGVNGSLRFCMVLMVPLRFVCFRMVLMVVPLRFVWCSWFHYVLYVSVWC